jgi:hypothetical protein
MKTPIKLIISLLLPLGINLPRAAEDTTSYFGWNLGFSPAKTSLGLSWAKGYNQWNAGFLVPPYHDDNDFTTMIPALTYNRQLTRNNVFVSGGFIAPHTSKSSAIVYFDSTINNFRLENSGEDRGWEPVRLMLGGGKVFQFKSWGIHVDACIITPTNEQLGRTWAWLAGAGVSFRGILK